MIGLFVDHDGWDWGHASWIGVYWLLDRCSLLLVGEKFFKPMLGAHPLPTITTKTKKTKQKIGGKFVVSFVSIIHGTDSYSETNLEPEDDTSSSQADTQQVHPALTPLETLAGIEDPVFAFFVVPATSAEEKLNQSSSIERTLLHHILCLNLSKKKVCLNYPFIVQLHKLSWRKWATTLKIQ